MAAYLRAWLDEVPDTAAGIAKAIGKISVPEPWAKWRKVFHEKPCCAAASNMDAATGCAPYATWWTRAAGARGNIGPSLHRLLIMALLNGSPLLRHGWM
jgi:hypothetical protein